MIKYKQSFIYEFLKNKKIFLLCILSGCGIFLLSCSIFTEPEPFENKDVHPPTAGYYPEIHYQAGDTVNGIMNLQFFAPVDSAQITMVRLFIDSTFVQSLNSPPFKFSINTQPLANGSHQVFFYVYKRITM